MISYIGSFIQVVDNLALWMLCLKSIKHCLETFQNYDLYFQLLIHYLWLCWVFLLLLLLFFSLNALLWMSINLTIYLNVLLAKLIKVRIVLWHQLMWINFSLMSLLMKLLIFAVLSYFSLKWQFPALTKKKCLKHFH